MIWINVLKIAEIWFYKKFALPNRAKMGNHVKLKNHCLLTHHFYIEKISNAVVVGITTTHNLE